jgi:hypothetical protein
MKMNTAGGEAHAGADFEELSAQGFNLGRALGQRQLQTKEVDQVVGGVQERAEGVGQKAVTTQATKHLKDVGHSSHGSSRVKQSFAFRMKAP